MSEYRAVPSTDTLPLFAPRETPEDPQPILGSLEARDTAWIEGLRAKLRELYEHRRATWPASGMPAYVCADDARKLTRIYPELRVPAGTSNNALGAIFRAKGWRRIGDTFSTTDGAHGNRIGTYQWSGE